MKLKKLTLVMLLAAFGMNAEKVRDDLTENIEWSDSIMSLDEVAVTAIKEHRLIDRAAVAVSLIDNKQVDRLGIENVKEAAMLVPNFFIPDYGSRMTSSIYVRGLGARIDQPAVGLNVDNVPFLNKDNYDFDLPDIDRIEVFRGPQSTLYGRNTLSGLVSIYTLSPMKYQGVRAMAKYGSANTMNFSVGLYHKLSNKLGMSLSGSYSQSDGFYTNGYNNSKTDHGRYGSVRWKTVWRSSDKLSIDNTASVNINREGGYPYESVETGVISYNDTCFYRRTGVSDGLTINYVLPGVALSSITSFQYINDNMTLDQDFLPISYFTLTQRRHEWAITQDFIARGSKGGYNWLGGLFGFYKRGNMSAPVTFKDDGIRLLIENNANRPGMPVEIKFDERELLLGSDFKMPTYGFALYHRSSVALGNFTLAADLRLDYEHTSLDYHNFTETSYTVWNKRLTPSIPMQTVPVKFDENEVLNRSFIELLPKISVEYSLSSATLFGSVSKGYKAGGFNTQMFSDVLQQSLMAQFGIAPAYDVEKIVKYDPEKSLNYEIGARYTSPSGKFSGSATVFYINCYDQQLTVFPAGQTTGRVMTNAGRTRSCGAELTASWMPVKGLSLTGTYGFTDARFRKFIDGENNYRGNRVPYAPQNTFYGSVQYDFDFGGSYFFKSLSLRCGVRGVGSIYWNEANDLKQPFYALVDASALVKLPMGFSFELSGENILDTKFNIFYFKSIGNSFLQRGKPARIFGTLRFTI
ncbi:MAG: TonB-dependent receptor [Muribaculaceae bacterium]|nr:TonB-dependent receptor [Muribaculaceae bacterium]